MTDRTTRSFTAVNNAAQSPNLVHSDAAARRMGLSSAAVPASSLLCHLLDFAREVAGFTTSQRAAEIRFLKPIGNGESVEMSIDGSGINLLGSDGSLAVTGSLSSSLDVEATRADYQTRKAGPRPLTTEGLTGDHRMTEYRFGCSRTCAEQFVESCGMGGVIEDVPTAYLISRFVPYLAQNFTRREPSLYAKVNLLVGPTVAFGESLEMRGKVARVYQRNQRDLVDIDTSWFDSGHRRRLWARHTLVYGLGNNPTSPGLRRT